MIKVGSKIRSYSFPHTDEFYVEGTVTNICDATKTYTVTVDVDTEFPVGYRTEVTTAMMGFQMCDDMFRPRIQAI